MALDDELDDTMRAAASLVAVLSETPATPSEFDAPHTVDAASLNFLDTTWIEGVVEVQDWLRLDEPLRLEDGLNYVVRRLLQGVAPTTSVDQLVSPADDAILSPLGLEVLTSRLERAVALRDRFLDDLEALGRNGATADWVSAWDELSEDSLSGPIRARATTWSIQDFAIRAENRQLDLSPTYQRGDVWPTKDAQLLIESVLRGIPLPSIIVLDPHNGSGINYEVVDGKQRLSTILRFIGRHPIAIQHIADLAEAHPEHPWQATFESDYPGFRQLWRQVFGRALTLTQEKELYFPFKLAADLGASQGSSSPLASFASRYYTELTTAGAQVDVAGSTTTVQSLFEGFSDYQIPVIEYTEASPRQIHEVFNIYNRQGKHLNAEEIRNAVYHDLPLMRLLTEAAGDSPVVRRASRFATKVDDETDSLESIFADYGVSKPRFRRTKILSWITAATMASCLGPDGTPRKLSTSQQINALLDRASDPGDRLNGRGRAAEALAVVAYALRAHHGFDGWSATFRGGRRWQDLPLVATVTPLVLAAPILGDELEERLRSNHTRIHDLTSSVWERPRKTQTNIQWGFHARVTVGLLDALGVSPLEVTDTFIRQFGACSLPGLMLIDGAADRMT